MGFKRDIPSGKYVSRDEHEECIKRLEAEDRRLGHRVEIIEKLDEKIYQIISSIEKMSANVEHMLKSLEKQEKRIDEHDVRLDNIATKGSKKWDNISEHIWKYLAVAIVAYMLFKAGIFQIP